MKNLIQRLHNKKILITGANGFLGSHLIRQLKIISSNIYSYDKDVRNIDKFAERFDIVYHLAAVNKIKSDSEKELLFDVNVNGTLAVMHYCCKTGARCIFTSSSAVYKPTTDDRPLNENSYIRPISLYGISKVLAENICKSHAQNFGISVTIFRIFNVYGPGQKTPFLIPYLVEQLSKNRSISLKMPKVLRDFVFVADVVKALILSLSFDHKGFAVLNIGTGQGLSLYNIAERLALRMGSTLRINDQDIESHEKNCVVADVSNISKILNWSPTVLIEEGLEKVVTKDRR